MPLTSLLTALDRKMILFSYEKKTKSEFPVFSRYLNDEFRSYILTEGEYILWELEKRKLTEREVIAHSWLITSKDNHSLLLCFKDESSLNISSLFDNESYCGSWLLKDGILKIQFNYKEHDYDIDVIANNNQSVHSAIQVIDDLSVDILKVVPVSQARYGNALVE